jgi:hypothetical protein
MKKEGLKKVITIETLTNLALKRLFAKIAPHEINHHDPLSSNRAIIHAEWGYSARAG